MSDRPTVIISFRVYRLLLEAYPRQYRQQYGDAMAQVFRDLCLRSGKNGLAGVWGRALLDYVVSLVSEYIDRGEVMTKAKWIQMSGWSFVAGGGLFLIGLLASSRPDYSPYNAASWPIDAFLNQADTILLGLAMLLISLGMAGLLARFQERLAVMGKAVIRMGIGGGLVSAAGVLGASFWQDGPWWYPFMIGLVILNISLAAFGALCLRQHLFARWNGLPLIIGATILATTLLSAATGEWLDPYASLIFTFFATSIALVGYRLQLETKTASPLT